MYKGARMTDHNMNKGGYGRISVEQAIWYSSNIGVAKTILKGYSDNPTKCVEGLYRIGMNADLRLEIPGAGRAKIRRPDDTTRYWSKTTLPWMSFGYETQVPPINTLAFFNAIANNGEMVRPMCTKEILHNGKTVQSFSTEVINSSICSDHTLALIKDMLLGVVEKGTGKAVHSDIVRIAGKTGTAQITDARSREGRYYLGSMVAYFPADAPRYTVLTTIETRAQAGKAYYGGPLAGPVVKRMVDYIFNRGRDWYGRVDDGGPRRYPDRMKGGDIAQVRRVADRLSPRASFESRTGWGRVTVDSLSNVVITSLPGDRGVMPDVRGMGLKDALFVLESRGLKVRFSGRGAVTQQSITAGARIAPGTAVVITLK